MEDKNTTGTETTVTETQETETKTYTQEEVNALLQQEGDKRVTQALKKQQEKFEKEKAEFEKLRDMDENQKKEYEYNKRVEELEAKEKEFVLTQNKLEASKVMADRGLPITFVDYITQRLAQPAPKGSNVTQQGMTKEEFRKLSLAQQSEIYRTNPELYKQMTVH